MCFANTDKKGYKLLAGARCGATGRKITFIAAGVIYAFKKMIQLKYLNS
jgi:hypothetical protein